MKKIIVLTTILCLLLGGCTNSQSDNSETAASADNINSVTAENACTINPLPDTTMENLTDAILSVSLKEGDAYVDDNGKIQMNLKIYTYDKYDMIDIAQLQIGDIIVRYSGEVKVISKEQRDSGIISINGGMENGGFDLVTDDCGIYFETGFNDAKNWYEIGNATIRVSADFKGIDCMDPDQGDILLYPGDFLIGAVTNYDFTPFNTTIRVEDGQIVELTRVYIP